MKIFKIHSIKSNISKLTEQGFNRVKNIFTKPSKKTFGKIGLFLIFGMIIININIKTNENTISLSSRFVEAAFGDIPEGGEWMTVAGNAVAGDGESNEDRFTLRVFNWLLWSVTVIVSKLNLFAAYVFDMAVDVDFIREKLSSPELYQAWSVVRDFFNLFFMIILLFSAFATIFQIEKYHLKKMIVLLVVMALLVNFSYPIALFIIDISNSVMQYIISAISPDQISANRSESALIAKMSKVGVLNKDLIKGNETVTTQLLFSVLIMFILFITLFAFAINLFIRIFALAILLILAPVGFAFSFFPATKSIADSWWSNLFKYSIMGPVLAFFLLLAIFLFDGVNTSSTALNERGLAQSLAGFAMPILFLWMGLIASQKFGGMASATAMSVAKNTGNKIRGYAQRGAWGGAKMAGRSFDDRVMGNRIGGSAAAIKMGWNSLGNSAKTRRDTKATEIAGKMGVEGAEEKAVQDIRKKLKDKGGATESDVERLERGTKSEKIAAAMERVENVGFNKDSTVAMDQYRSARALIQSSGSPVHKKDFEKYSIEKNIDLVANSRLEDETTKAGGPLSSTEISRHLEEEFSKVNPDQWRNQNIERLVNTTTNKRLIKQATKDVIGGYSTAAQDSVTKNMGGNKYAKGKTEGLWI